MLNKFVGTKLDKQQIKVLVANKQLVMAFQKGSKRQIDAKLWHVCLKELKQ
jgi:hypothetical protein